MAKTRRGSRKTSAARARSPKKSAAKRTRKSSAKARKPAGLDLKKLRADIAKARDAVEKRLLGAHPQKADKLRQTQSTLDRWAFDIDSICGATEADEPCGTTMVIS